jgi:hypothetical protein
MARVFFKLSSVYNLGLYTPSFHLLSLFFQIKNMSEAPETVPPPPPQASKPRIRPELIISLFSISLSLVAVATNLFQARLQTQQQQSAVWPYLDANLGISQDGFSFSVSNKGVGPAIVTQETYRYEGKEFHNMVDLIKFMAGTNALDYAIFETSPIKNHVLSPQEKWLVFRISDPKMAELAIQNAENVQLSIEYRSVYGKRWICRGIQTEEIE